MLKKLTIALVLSFLTFAVLSAQSVEVKPYGISARGVDADTEDIFDLKYNGSKNVGVGTKIYLAGMVMDTTFIAPVWNILEQPAGSAISIIANQDMGETTKLISLIPDVAGTYKVEFVDGMMSDTVTINAALYLGLPTAGFGCATCHGDYVADWQGTGHANAVQPNVDDPTGHFQSFCMGCHTTGFDANAANDGFDDFDFVFPDTLKEGNYDALVAAYPDAMRRANVQCEACHGPGSAHFSGSPTTEDSKMVSSLAKENCGYCHDAGTHHVFPNQWDNSGHAAPPMRDTWSASCARCHTGEGFIQYADGETVTSQPGGGAITCAVCHDPHSAANDHQIRKMDAVTLSNNDVVDQGGRGLLCMNCHMSRRDASTYAPSSSGNHFGPHYMPQADMLAGKNVYTFGVELPNSPHNRIENTCVTCHMSPAGVDGEGNVILVGAHTFNVVDPSGNDNVSICEDCHGNVGTSFDQKKFYMNGNADHDGDGVEEGLQEEVKGLLYELASLIPHADSVDGYDAHDSVPAEWDSLYKIAAYNYEMVYYDHSYGIHNPAFTVSLLQVTIGQLKTVGVEKIDVLPAVYSLAQNYPNPFNPTTKINFAIPKAGEVKLAIYDALGREVQVLINKTMEAGTYNFEWNAANFAAGIYFYKIQANDFVSTKKMVLLK